MSFRNQILRVGLAQMDCQLGNLEANLAKIESLIAEYRQDTDLLVFPELSLTGYSVGSRFAELALRLDSPQFKKLLKATQGISVAVGFIEETDDFRFYNSLAYLQDGELKGVHRKIYPPNYGIFEERKYFACGENYDFVQAGNFKTAPFICGDAWNPGLVHLSAIGGAHLLMFSVASPAGGLGSKVSSSEGWQRLNRFYASMYGSYVLFVNRVGTEGDISFWGESEIIDPLGQVVARSDSDRPEVVLGTLDLEKVKEARTILPTIRDEHPGFLMRQMARLSETSV